MSTNDNRVARVQVLRGARKRWQPVRHHSPCHAIPDTADAHDLTRHFGCVCCVRQCRYGPKVLLDLNAQDGGDPALFRHVRLLRTQLLLLRATFEVEWNILMS